MKITKRCYWQRVKYTDKKNKEHKRLVNKNYREQNKEKIKQWQSEYRKSKHGVLIKMYGHMKDRFKNPKFPYIDVLCTKEEFYEFIDNSEFEIIYNLWALSGYDTKLAPSIDRIDCDKGYSTDNMQILTLSDNSTKGDYERRKGRYYVRLEKNGNVFYFESAKSASTWMGLDRNCVSAAIRRSGLVGGYLPTKITEKEYKDNIR